MEQYVKGFQRFHAGEDVRPLTSCKFLLYYYCYYYHFCCRCCCCRWWHWLLGLIVLRPSNSSLLQSATSVITKCDSFFYYKVRWSVITKCDSFFYYKVRWSVITKCDSFFITKCDRCYYKVRQVLQSTTVLTVWQYYSWSPTALGPQFLTFLNRLNILLVLRLSWIHLPLLKILPISISFGAKDKS